MSANQSAYAQRKTNSFVVIPQYVTEGDGAYLSSNCYLISEADVAQWLKDNASKITRVGNVVTTSVANFPDLVGNSGNGIWANKYYTILPNIGYVDMGTTLTDLGKDLYIGVPGESNLLHYRLVQAPGSVANAGKGGIVGYVVVEANADIFTASIVGNSYPSVAVARV